MCIRDSPYRERRFFSWFGLMTTTVSPASSSSATTGPSGRSIATSAQPGLGGVASQLSQPGAGMRHREPVDRGAGAVHHRDDVIVFRPVHSGGPAIGRIRRQFGGTGSSPGGLCWGILHRSLFAASPSGEAPDLRCQDAAAGSLTVRRSVALSPVDGRRVLGNRRVSHISSWTSQRQALSLIHISEPTRPY